MGTSAVSLPVQPSSHPQTVMAEGDGAAELSASVGSVFPGLPDDLAVECIARIPRFFYSSLALVSRSWRAVFRSSDLLASRVSLRTSQNLLFIAVRTSVETSKWFLLDPDGTHPNILISLPPPPIPASGSACVTVGPRLFVLGGSVNGIPSPSLQIYDSRFNRWNLGPRMRSPREFAAAGAIDGKIFVLGGCLPSDRWAECFDVATSHWTSISSPIVRQEKWMHGSVVLDGKLLAMADRGGFVFDPASGSWNLVSIALDLGWRGCAAAVNGIIYSYDYLGKIKGFDLQENRWREIEGVKDRLPVFLAGARVAGFGNLLCVVWEGRGEREKGFRLMLSTIKVEKVDGGRLVGKIVWKEGFDLGVGLNSVISHCLSAQF